MEEEAQYESSLEMAKMSSNEIFMISRVVSLVLS